MTDNLLPFKQDNVRELRITPPLSQSSQNNSTFSPMVKRKRQIKSLDQTFFIRLLQVEEHISKKNITKEIINEVVGLYAKCVEYYDSVSDSIKVYFLEKIQITLSSMESLKVIYSSEVESDKPQQDLKRKQETENVRTQNKNATQKSPYQISQIPSNNSLQTYKFNSEVSSKQSYNNLSSVRNKTNTREVSSTDKLESIQIRDFSTSTPVIENKCRRNNESFDYMSVRTYQSKDSKNEGSIKTKESSLSQHEQIKLNQFNLDQESQENNNQLTNSESENNAVIFNGIQHQLVTIQSSFLQQSTTQFNKITDQYNDQIFQNNISQNNVVVESFIEEEINQSSSRIRFTLNPNTLLQFDLNISDLNLENDISNASHNSRIEMNVKNIIGDLNYRDNNCAKNILIEHGKSLFNKNLSRQANNIFKISSQNISGEKNNQTIMEENNQFIEEDNNNQIINQNSLLTECSTSMSCNAEKNVLGDRKLQNDNKKINSNQLKSGLLHKQQSMDLDYYKNHMKKNTEISQNQLVDNKENYSQDQNEYAQQYYQLNSKENQQKNKQFSQIPNNISEYSIQKKKIERSKRFSMFITMQNEKKQSVIKFEQDAEQKDQIVKSDIENQVEIIKQRLEYRKSKNIKEKVIKDIQSRKDNSQSLLKDNLSLLSGSQILRF